MRRSTSALVAALVFALLFAGGFALGPTVSSSETTVTSDGGVATEESTSSLLQEEGTGVLVVLVVPAALAGIALACRRRRVSLLLGWLLVCGCLLALLSVGLFALPTAVLLLVAGYAEDKESHEQVFASVERA